MYHVIQLSYLIVADIMSKYKEHFINIFVQANEIISFYNDTLNKL